MCEWNVQEANIETHGLVILVAFAAQFHIPMITLVMDVLVA